MSMEDAIPHGPLVVQTHGHTPPFWKDRSAMFIACPDDESPIPPEELKGLRIIMH